MKALRLLGVYLVVIGAADLVEDGVNLLNYSQYAPDSYWQLHGRMVGSCVFLGAGLYFILGGRWLIERVFLPVDRADD